MVPPPNKRQRRQSFSSSGPSRGRRHSSATGLPRTLASRGRSSIHQQRYSTLAGLSSRSALLARSTSSAQSSPGFEPENDFDVSQREESDDLNQVIMAVDITGNRTLGCCYYVAREEKLYLLQDVKAAVKGGIEPTVLLLSSRVNLEVDDRESSQTMTGDREIDRFRLPYDVEVRPNQEFNYENGKAKLLSLRLRSYDQRLVTFLTPGVSMGQENDEMHDEVGVNGQQGKLLYISSAVDIDNRVTLGCTGALLSYLQRLRSSAYLPGDPAANALYRVITVGMFALKETMFINADTLDSLQIIHAESHPNTFNQGPGKASSGSKENLSIYGLFCDLVHTPQGKQRLRQLFMRPSLNLSIINRRLDLISVFLRPENADPLDKVVSSLKRIKNLHPVMVHLHKGISGGSNKLGAFRSGVWATLLAFAFHALDLRITIREIAGRESIPLVTEVIEKLNSDQLHSIGRTIHEEIDMEASTDQNRTVFKWGIDKDLDGMKEIYNGMDDLLSKVAHDIASDFARGIELTVIYFPQIGFLVVVPTRTAEKLALEGNAEGRRWERIFTSNEKVYYKESKTLEMDDTFGDIYAIICEKEIELAHDLAQRVLEYENMLVEVSDVLGELDSLLALAQGAQMHKFTRPRVTERNIISIKAGRHPLHELTVPSYVANDTFLVGGRGNDAFRDLDGVSSTSQVEEQAEGPSMLLLTGPNYSGKSVHQKQVALIVYLSHIGSFVPADRAVVGLTDKILTRINTRETVSKIQSAFVLDLQQIALSMTLATHRSLIIIDEFGKGTDSSDGAGLACGVLEYLLSLGEYRPKVLAATHFHEIFENDFLPLRPELSFGHMQIRLDSHAKEVENQITYLYSFREGLNSTSFGTNCAAMNGIDVAIINRANELQRLDDKGENLLAVCSNVTLEEEEALQDAEAIARSFLIKDFSSGLSEGSNGTTEDPRTSLEEVLSNVAVVESN